MVLSFLVGGQVQAGAAGEDSKKWRTCSRQDAKPDCPGPLRTARFMHTAALLDGSRCKENAPPDYCGKVLVTGGDDDFCVECSPYTSTELYDPKTGTWQTATESKSARTNHTATMLPDGRVLVVGGLGAGSGFVGASEVYDPGKKTWSEGPPRAGLGRFYHTATPTGRGKVLVAGGTDSETLHPGLDSAYLYDSARNRWTPTKKMVRKRGHHAAAALSDGSVLVSGGFDGAKGPLSSAEIYDPKSDDWREVRKMATKRLAHTATLLPNGKVLVSGGTNRSVQTEGGLEVEFLRSTEIYDPKTNRWRSGPEMQKGHAAHTATTLVNGAILVVGGSRPFSLAPRPESVAAAEIYDGRPSKWSPAGELNDARGLHTATLLDGPSCRSDSPASYCGRTLIAGGGNSTMKQSSNVLGTEGSTELSPAGLDAKSPSRAVLTGATIAIAGCAFALVAVRRRIRFRARR